MTIEKLVINHSNDIRNDIQDKVLATRCSVTNNQSFEPSAESVSKTSMQNTYQDLNKARIRAVEYLEEVSLRLTQSKMKSQISKEKHQESLLAAVESLLTIEAALEEIRQHSGN